VLEVHEALERLWGAVVPLPAAEVALPEAAGRRLAEPVLADRDGPATDRSAMDGYAVRATDCAIAGRTLALTGEVRAGQDPAALAVGAGEAVRIFTGAVMPRGADAVVMIEVASENPDAATVLVRESVAPGQHIRTQGEEYRSGSAVLATGALVRPAELAVLAAMGRNRVRVFGLPRVAVISTGDELVEPGTAPAPHQVRNSNAALLMGALKSLGVGARDLGVVLDRPAALDAAISPGLTHDVLLLTGGVSVGAYDLVGEALARAGCKILFHNVAIRPGKPILAATGPGCVVFGLPGNPVSAFTCFQVFVVPALRRLMADPHPTPATLRAVLVEPLIRRPGRLTYHLARLSRHDGALAVTPAPGRSSGDVVSLARADAFIVAAGDTTPLPAGSTVDVLPWA